MERLASGAFDGLLREIRDADNDGLKAAAVRLFAARQDMELQQLIALLQPDRVMSSTVMQILSSTPVGAVTGDQTRRAVDMSWRGEQGDGYRRK